MSQALKVAYLSGTRADFGLMADSLLALDADAGIDLTVVACGQHLDPAYGDTIKDIIATGLQVAPLDAIKMAGASGAGMAYAVAGQTQQITAFFETHRPDLMILLGDRGEMLAAGLAAVFLGIPVAHFHGGDRSGTVDDQLRQAITSLSHYHFPATPGARDRLIRMGEQPGHIHMLGAPGLDEIRRFEPDDGLRASLGIDQNEKLATVLFHPVVQDVDLARAQAQTLIEAVADRLAGAVVVLAPNSDAGAAQISTYYRQAQTWAANQSDIAARFIWVTHLPRTAYLSLIAQSELMLGNSSSSVIEAASLRTPVVNVGDRQNARERNDSLFDCDIVDTDIKNAINRAMSYDGSFGNLYDQGGCAPRLADIVRSLDLSPAILKKQFVY